MGRKRNPNKFYFTQETEDAIVAYVKSTDERERNQLFNNHIYKPFLKIAEVVLNKYKIQYLESEPIDAMNDAVIFMYEQLGKFNQGSGKAFSYFTIVCRNYYIQLSNKNYKTQKKVLKIGDNLDKYDREDDDKRPQEMEDNAVLLAKFIDYLEEHFDKLFNKKHESVFGKHMIEFLKDVDSIQDFTPRGVLRELCEGVPQIARNRVRKLLNRLEVHYEKFKEGYKKGITIPFYSAKQLNKSQINYIKTNYKVNCKQFGMVALSKKFSVNEEDIRRAFYS